MKRIELAQFGAFERANLDFVDGLNVFLGPNGTGKTHMMKVLYAVLATARGATPATFRDKLATKLAGVFKPEDDEIRRLVRRRHGLNTATVTVLTGPAGSASSSRSPSIHVAARFRLHTRGKMTASVDPDAVTSRSIFLPTREVLAMYEGFISAYSQRELSFDETYFDACVALNANPLRGQRKATAERLATKLRAALGGHVVLAGGRFYVKFDNESARMEAQLVAEGLRKIASLERLVLNGSLMRNGHLFWDEPEANLNPQLTVVIVDVLAELARAGIQVFLTTHDYLLARRLTLQSRMPKFPPTRFFAFHRPEPSAPARVDHADSLSELPDNPIVQEFTRLYDLEMKVAAES